MHKIQHNIYTSNQIFTLSIVSIFQAMHILRRYFVSLIMVFLPAYLIAQENNEKPFSNGQPIGTVFANFHTRINHGNNPSAFEVRRAYLGYYFHLSEYYSTKIVLDIGSPDDVSQYSLLRRFAYFKEANLQYKKGRITVLFGIIPLQQFKLQEKIWRHRYIYESVLDEHGLGSSADLGASINYKATSFLEFDFTMMNGEGYSNLQTDYSYKSGLGLTIRPWKGLIVRSYFDAIRKNEMMVTIVNFIAYEIRDRLSFGFEYDIKLNDGFEQDQDIHIFSGYLSYDVNKKFEVFARYDFLESNKVNGEATPWNLPDDGSAIIAGVQYKPIDKLRMSVNYQDWVPYAKNLESEAYIYFNLEFKIW